MEEVRRFLRFTLPGMACVIELLVALTISDFATIKGFLSFVKENSAVGIAISFLLASGAIGYILANIYFALYWVKPFSDLIAIDHLSFLKSINNEFDLLDASGNRIDVRKISSRRDAWTILSHYWWSRIESDEGIKGTNAFTDRLVDITHSIGATFIGTLFACLAWASMHFYFLGNSRGWGLRMIITITLWILLFFTFGYNFVRTVKAHQSIANSTVLDSILRESKNGCKATIHWVK